MSLELFIREILGMKLTEKINSFNSIFISDSNATEESVREVYDFLKSKDVSDKKIVKYITLLVNDPENIKRNYANLTSYGMTNKQNVAQIQLLGRNPELIERNYLNLRTYGLKDKNIATSTTLLSRDPETIERNYLNLRSHGITDKNIATNATLLGKDPKTIQKHFQNLRRYLSQEAIQNSSSLLSLPNVTIDANIQYLSNIFNKIPSRFMLGTKPSTKRKKLAFLLREVFDYRNSPDKKQSMEEMYSFIRINPQYIIKSISAMEKELPKIMKKAEPYRTIK